MKQFIFFVVLSMVGLGYCDVFRTVKSWVDLATDSASTFYCNWNECCRTLPYKPESLKSTIITKLYGQHIATDIVLNAFYSHIKKKKPKKPLVLSFHGANGIGKTYVTRMIAKALYEKGENSQFYHFYYGLENFATAEKLSEYQDKLKYDIETAINRCGRSLFVFDGVDYMPSGLLNVLMPFIDCPNCAGKDKKNKSIFIFLTNTGSLAIEKLLLEKMQGISRESTTLQDFEKIIIAETSNRRGGLYESLMIKSDAIDFYVPFLPLEKRHVEKCIKDAFEELKVSPTEDLINNIFMELRFGPEPDNLFSVSGCKRVAQIVGMISTKFDLSFNDFDDTNEKELMHSEL